MSYETLRYEVQDAILTLTLDRPDNMNAFTVTMANELVDAFNRASDDDEVAAVVVTGEGRAFCAGMDLSVDGNEFGLNQALKPTLKDIQERFDEPEMIDGVRDTGGRVVLAIYACKKPVIAAINGAAVGIGATMTCAMDIRLVSEHAKVGFVFNKIGITPEACSTWFLPRIVTMQTALEWCYTGEIHNAEVLVESGFAKAVYPAESLLDEAYKLAEKFTRHSPVAIALTRQMMYRNSAQDHPVKAHEIESLSVFYTCEDSGADGVPAFLEKRAPKFTGEASTDMPDFYPWWHD